MNTKMVKNIEIEAIFTLTEMNKEWEVNFLQNRPCGIQNTYASEFLYSVLYLCLHILSISKS